MFIYDIFNIFQICIDLYILCIGCYRKFDILLYYEVVLYSYSMYDIFGILGYIYNKVFWYCQYWKFLGMKVEKEIR